VVVKTSFSFLIGSGKRSFLQLQVLVLLIFPVFLPVSAVAVSNDKTFVLQQIDQTTGRVNRPVAPVKNVIVMIPDGCSLATVSAARWYNWLLNPDHPALYIDPYICGTVRTFSSNAPIGDSAPTTSCYMTGQPSRTGFVATYPVADPINDIFSTDPTKAYQPLMTVLEAARLVNGQSTGLVFTCEFPHATPADCSSHSYNRNDYTSITQQMVHNQLDVVIGGGVKLLKDSFQLFLKNQNYTVQLNDLNALRSFSGKKLWSLFGDADMPYEIDRQPDVTPSLEEMTQKAIQLLSTNKKGFFLMVEGSKVDWAAHANDAVGMVSEFVAFDKACKVALDFAKKDGNTAVIILPDHGNSGISIGVGRMEGYDRLSKEQIFGPLLKFKKSAEGLAKLLNASKREEIGSIFMQYTGIVLLPTDYQLIDLAKDYVNSPIPAIQRSRNSSLQYQVANIMSLRTGIGFTTNGHTGEEVFLAAYHPKNEVPTGVRLNVEINDYLCELMGLKNRLPGLTASYFAKHTDVFKGMSCTITDQPDKHPVLTVENKGKVLKLTDDSNTAELNGKPMLLSTVVVYVDKNKTFYLPEKLVNLLK